MKAGSFCFPYKFKWVAAAVRRRTAVVGVEDEKFSVSFEFILDTSTFRRDLLVGGWTGAGEMSSSSSALLLLSSSELFARSYSSFSQSSLRRRLRLTPPLLAVAAVVGVVDGENHLVSVCGKMLETRDFTFPIIELFASSRSSALCCDDD